MARRKIGSDRRIAFIIKNFLPPTQIWIVRQANGLSRFKPIFFVKKKTRNTPKTDHRIFVIGKYLSVIVFFNLIGKAVSKNNMWCSAWFMNVILRWKRVQLIHIHFLWNAVWFFSFKDNVKVPVVVTAHGSDVLHAFSNPEYKKQIQAIFHKVDTILCVSEFIKQKLLDLGCDKTKLLVNHLGLPIKSIVHHTKKDKEHIKLICVAALRAEKGHLYLLKAFERVKKRFKDIRLYLVGDGDIKTELAQAVKDLGLEDCVEFLSWKTEDEVFELLAAADIYVQHSIRFKAVGRWKEEALSISLVEAASMGLPLVATDIGGIPEICIHGYNGLLSNEKDVQAMAENIIYFIKNPDARFHYGQMGKKLVSEKFDESRVLSQLENIYQSLIDGFNHIKK